MMKRQLLAIISLLTASSVLAGPPNVLRQSDSLSTAVLEIQAARHANGEKTTEPAKSYQHKDESRNSLARGALAKQGVPQKIAITSMSQISTEQYDPKENNNSLLRAALSMHYKATH